MRFSDYIGNIKILTFPELRQVYSFDCGANALQSILTYYGYDIREEEIMRMAGTTEENGTSPSGLMSVAKKYGIPNEFHENLTIDFLKKCIDNGFPVIISLQAWVDDPDRIDWNNTWDEGHYVIAIGYDNRRIYFEDPSSTKRTSLTFEELDERWHDIEEDGKKYYHHGIIFKGIPKYRYNDIEHMG